MSEKSKTPSAQLFAKLLGSGPLAKVALQAALERLDAAAFIASTTGTILHANREGQQRATRSKDRLRSKLSRIIATRRDPNVGAGVFVTPLRVGTLPEYFLITFRLPASLQDGVTYAARLWELTPRQVQVLSGVAEGFSNKTIAVRLGCTERTIEAHLTAIFAKSGLEGRTELMAAMLKNKV